jgi:ribosomal protein S5
MFGARPPGLSDEWPKRRINERAAATQTIVSDATGQMGGGKMTKQKVRQCISKRILNAVKNIKPKERN